MPFTFRFRWIPFIATVIVFAIGISLGNWQTRRATEKEAIAATLKAREAEPVLEIGSDKLASEAHEFRRVRIKGRFQANWPIYLDNRPYKGQAGFYLLMPVTISGTDKAVLVARGWIPRNPANRTRLPEIYTPATEVVIEGTVRRQTGRLFQLGEPVPLQPGAIVQNATVAEVATATKLNLQPLLIEQTSGLDDGLVRDWPEPAHGMDKHRGYAFQWYALAATAFLFFVVTGFRRGTKQ